MSKEKFRKKKWKIWLGSIISLITLWLACYNVQWEYLVQAIRETDIAFILLGMACLCINLILRAWRWQLLLRPIGRFRILKACFPYYMIGYMSNLILPLRAGEIIRPYFFGKKMAVSKTAIFATIFIERLIDMVFLTCLLSFLIIIGVMHVPVNITRGAFLVGGIAFFLLFFLWIISHRSQFFIKFKWTNRFPQNISNKFEVLLKSAVEGLKILNNAGMFAIVSCITLCIWLCGVFTIQSYLLSFNIAVPWYAPIFVIVVTSMGMMIPSSPGFIGVAHFLYVFSLSLFGIEKDIALGFAIVIHGLGFILIVALGLISLWTEGLSFSTLSSHKLKENFSSLKER